MQPRMQYKPLFPIYFAILQVNRASLSLDLSCIFAAAMAMKKRQGELIMY